MPGPFFDSAMTITLYGIPNCDTVKNARTWLADQHSGFHVPRFQKAGPGPRHRLPPGCDQRDWEVLVNRKGTTWRGLSDEQKAAVTDKASAPLALMLATTVGHQAPGPGQAPARCRSAFTPDLYAGDVHNERRR